MEQDIQPQVLLQASGLTCQRNERLLFRDVNLVVNHGDVVQILGKNGVGKTSLLRLLIGLLPARQGHVLWQGKPIQNNLPDFYRHIFYVGHERGIKDDLTVYENMQMDGRYAIPKHDDLIAAITAMQLDEYARRLCSEVSQGQRLRVALAKLLLTKAMLWVLDEPFAALDSKGINDVERLMQRHVAQGGAIVLTTHRPLMSSSIPLRSLDLERYTEAHKQGCL